MLVEKEYGMSNCGYISISAFPTRFSHIYFFTSSVYGYLAHGECTVSPSDLM